MIEWEAFQYCQRNSFKSCRKVPGVVVILFNLSFVVWSFVSLVISFGLSINWGMIRSRPLVIFDSTHLEKCLEFGQYKWGSIIVTDLQIPLELHTLRTARPEFLSSLSLWRNWFYFYLFAICMHRRLWATWLPRPVPRSRRKYALRVLLGTRIYGCESVVESVRV